MKVIRRERVPSKDYPEKTLVEWDRWYALVDRNTGKYWSGGPIHSRKLSSELDEALIFSGNDLIGKHHYWHWFYSIDVTEDVLGPEEFAENLSKYRGGRKMRSNPTYNFQRRHYQFVADAITAAAYGHDDAKATKALMDVILVFAKRFKADNPMFRPTLFIDAAGGDFLMKEELELLYEKVGW